MKPSLTPLTTNLTYAWPSNVHELKNVIEFATIGCKGWRINAPDLSPEISRSQLNAPASRFALCTGHDEGTQLLRTFNQAEGNRAEAAKLLGMSRATLYRRLANHDIDIPR